METRFKDLSTDEKEELEYQFQENMIEAKYYHGMAMIELEAIFNMKKHSSTDFGYLAECQESYLQNCNQHLIAMNNINKLIRMI